MAGLRTRCRANTGSDTSSSTKSSPCYGENRIFTSNICICIFFKYFAYFIYNQTIAPFSLQGFLLLLLFAVNMMMISVYMLYIFCCASFVLVVSHLQFSHDQFHPLSYIMLTVKRKTLLAAFTCLFLIHKMCHKTHKIWCSLSSTTSVHQNTYRMLTCGDETRSL